VFVLWCAFVRDETSQIGAAPEMHHYSKMPKVKKPKKKKSSHKKLFKMAFDVLDDIFD